MNTTPGTEETNTPTTRLLLWLAVGLLIFAYKILLAPLLISALIAYLLYPFVTWLSSRAKQNRRTMVLIVYLIFILFICWAIIFLPPTIQAQAEALTAQFSRLPAEIAKIEADLHKSIGIRLPLSSSYQEYQDSMAGAFAPENLFRLILRTSNNIVWVIIIIITSFHLLRDWEKLREWLFALFTPSFEPEARRLHQDIKKVWQAYLRGQLIIMTILGILSGLAAWLIGLPGALLLGLLAGILALIPTLGPISATAIAGVVAWVQGSTHPGLTNLSATLAIVIAFQAIQLFEGFWLTPRIMGRRLNLHPGLVLLVVVGTLFTFGALISLIIIPLIGTADVIFRYIQAQRRPSPPPVEDPPTETHSAES